MLFLEDVPCPVVVTDALGAILKLNPSALVLTGGTTQDWCGQPLDHLLPLPSRMFLQTHVWPMLLRDGQVHEIHLQMFDAQRQRVPVMVNCQRTKTDGPVTYTWVLFVAADRSRFEAELLGARRRADEAATAAAASARFLRAITDAVPGMVGYWDRELHCRYANSGYLRWFDKPHHQVIGSPLHELMDPETLHFSQPFLQGVLAGRPQRFERSQALPDHGHGHALVNYIPDTDAQGQVVGFFVLAIDITSLKQAEDKLRLAASAVENTVEAIMVTDAQGLILSVNPAFTVITGYTAAQAIGQPANRLVAGRHDDAFHAQVQHELAVHGRWTGETWARRPDGSIYLVWQAVTVISAGPSVSQRQVSVFSDITERWHHNERLRHLAFHDPLTELPNRALLSERLAQLLGQTRREERSVAVMFLDLDRFKAVNDQLGHDVGDQLLKAVAADLLRLVRQVDTVARLGGDEFVIVLDNPGTRGQVEILAQRIVIALGQPRQIDGHPVSVGASVGIALYPSDGSTAETLIANADEGLYAAKGAGRNTYRFFSTAGALQNEAAAGDSRVTERAETGDWQVQDAG